MQDTKVEQVAGGKVEGGNTEVVPATTPAVIEGGRKKHSRHSKRRHHSKRRSGRGRSMRGGDELDGGKKCSMYGGDAVEGGRRKRSKRSVRLSKYARSMRKHKCPTGSHKDRRKMSKRNTSGCRKNKSMRGGSIQGGSVADAIAQAVTAAAVVTDIQA